MRIVSLCLIALLTASGTASQVVHEGTGHYCTLRVVDGEARSGGPLEAEAHTSARLAGTSSNLVTTVGARATLEVRYTGFTSEAQAAFQAAVDVWADHIGSPVPIRIEARFGALADNVLGSAGPRITANFGGGRAQTWYAFALADAIVGSDLFPPVEDNPDTPADEENWSPDIEATFNSAFDDFYFGTDGATPSGEFDFRSIVLHELGHGLGFVGSGEYDNGIISSDEPDPECDGVEGHGCWGIGSSVGTLPIIYDRLVEDDAGVAMINLRSYPQNSAALGTLLTSNGITTSIEEKEIFIDGATLREVFGGPVPIYAPRPAESGSSFSHWDEFIFRPSGGSNALMTPGIARGETYADPGALTCALFKDMGWTLAAGCSSLFPTAEAIGPEAADLALIRLGANPFRTSTSFQLVVPEAAEVSVRLVDALGRTVAGLYDGLVSSAGVRFEVDGGVLAPGVYTVQVLGFGAPVSAHVVRAR